MREGEKRFNPEDSGKNPDISTEADKAQQLIDSIGDVRQQVESALAAKQADVRKKADLIESINPQIKDLAVKKAELENNMEYFKNNEDVLDEQGKQAMAKTEKTISEVNVRMDDLNKLANRLHEDPDIQEEMQNRAEKDFAEHQEEAQKKSEREQKAKEFYKKCKEMLKEVSQKFEEIKSETNRRYEEFKQQNDFNQIKKEVEDGCAAIRDKKAAKLFKEKKRSEARTIEDELKEQKSMLIAEIAGIYNKGLRFFNQQDSENHYNVEADYPSLAKIFEASMSAENEEYGKEVKREKQELERKIEEFHKQNYEAHKELGKLITETFIELRNIGN